jgi:hypothetical protein
VQTGIVHANVFAHYATAGRALTGVLERRNLEAKSLGEQIIVNALSGRNAEGLKPPFLRTAGNVHAVGLGQPYQFRHQFRQVFGSTRADLVSRTGKGLQTALDFAINVYQTNDRPVSVPPEGFRQVLEIFPVK